VSDITSLRGAHTDSGLYPIIGQMERAAGLGRDDLALAKLEKLDAVLARTSTSIEDAALFAEMLSLPNDGRHPALDLTRNSTGKERSMRLAQAFCLRTRMAIFTSRHTVVTTLLNIHEPPPR
jgi:hypothetical protein